MASGTITQLIKHKKVTVSSGNSGVINLQLPNAIMLGISSKENGWHRLVPYTGSNYANGIVICDLITGAVSTDVTLELDIAYIPIGGDNS